jgi:hypothetical protein
VSLTGVEPAMYRSKWVIEAMGPIDRTNVYRILDWICEHDDGEHGAGINERYSGRSYISFNKDSWRAHEGDWVIRDCTTCRFRKCSAEVFAYTYERVD